jgi:diguanylate cyclase (GGDEF)-like protein
MTTSIIDSVVNITQQKDTSALESCLLDEIVNLCDQLQQTTLYGVDLEDDVWQYHEVCGRNGVNKTADLRLNTTISQQQLKTLEQGEPLQFIQDEYQHLLVPITQEYGLYAVLQIIATELSADFQYTIQTISRIYGNFIHLLIESERDKLTGLFNRGTFETRLKRLLIDQTKQESDDQALVVERRKESQGQQAWLVMLDIDHFKLVNDNFGHVYGDEVLLIFSQIMRDVFRKKDLLFRFGGEEFVVILEPISFENAKAAVERFRLRIEQYEFPQVGHVSVSIGFSKITQEDYPLEVLNFADKALYYAKNNGRNQVCNFHDLIQRGLIEQVEHVIGDIELF